MDWSERRRRFRAILAGERCIHPASVFDPISARIAEDLGFEAGMLAGSVASMTVLGAPDLIVLTLSELAAQAYRINRAGGLPLLVDADHGYGNALNAKRTVEELESAGVAALTIEDTVLPRPFGSDAPQLVPIAEGAGKLRAALAGRQDPALAIVGRTSAVTISGLDDAIARARAYADAGADALFFTGIGTRTQLDAIAAATDIPLMVAGVPAALADRDLLAARRVRICLQGHHPFMAAVRAVHDALTALRDGAAPAAVPVASAELMARVTRDADYKHWTKAFLDE